MNIPKGWKLVPVEPTQEMMEAGMNSTGDQLNGRPVWKATLDEQAAHIFRAMLDAAPTSPSQAQPLRLPEPMTDTEIDAAFLEQPAEGVRMLTAAFAAGVRLAERRVKEVNE